MMERCFVIHLILLISYFKLNLNVIDYVNSIIHNLKFAIHSLKLSLKNTSYVHSFTRKIRINRNKKIAFFVNLLISNSVNNSNNFYWFHCVFIQYCSYWGYLQVSNKCDT